MFPSCEMERRNTSLGTKVLLAALRGHATLYRPMPHSQGIWPCFIFLVDSWDMKGNLMEPSDITSNEEKWFVAMLAKNWKVRRLKCVRSCAQSHKFFHLLGFGKNAILRLMIHHFLCKHMQWIAYYGRTMLSSGAHSSPIRTADKSNGGRYEPQGRVWQNPPGGTFFW